MHERSLLIRTTLFLVLPFGVAGATLAMLLASGERDFLYISDCLNAYDRDTAAMLAVRWILWHICFVGTAFGKWLYLRGTHPSCGRLFWPLLYLVIALGTLYSGYNWTQRGPTANQTAACVADGVERCYGGSRGELLWDPDVEIGMVLLHYAFSALLFIELFVETTVIWWPRAEADADACCPHTAATVHTYSFLACCVLYILVFIVNDTIAFPDRDAPGFRWAAIVEWVMCLWHFVVVWLRADCASSTSMQCCCGGPMYEPCLCCCTPRAEGAEGKNEVILDVDLRSSQQI